MRKLQLLCRYCRESNKLVVAAEARTRELEGDAEVKGWQSARDFLLERGLMKDFLLWEAKRDGLSEFAYATLERALNRGDSVRVALFDREVSEGGGSLPAHDVPIQPPT